MNIENKTKKYKKNKTTKYKRGVLNEKYKIN